MMRGNDTYELAQALAYLLACMTPFTLPAAVWPSVCS